MAAGGGDRLPMASDAMTTDAMTTDALASDAPAAMPVGAYSRLERG